MDANGDDDKQVQWSTLPKDVIPILINRLETRIDLLRFRSVCRSWRSSSAASLSPQPPFPLLSPRRRPPPWHLHRRRDHRLPPPTVRRNSPQNYFPLSNQEVNLLEFRISQVHNSYTFRNLELLNRKPIEAGLPFVKKIVVLGSNPDSRIVVVVYEMWDLDGRLAMLRVGDDSWTPIYTQHFVCDDVIVYKGNFYTVDRSGRAFVLDPNMNLIEIAPPPTNENGKKKKKHLVESIGDLLLVDKYFELHERNVYYYKDGKERVKSSNREMVSEMRVYRLNEDEHRWVEVRSLEDQILFVGDDCSYSVSAREFPGCRGNRVVYEDRAVASQIEEEDELFDGLWVYQIGVFNLGNGRVRSLATCPQLARIFWPPPSSSGCSM
ncbi:F-box protein SKIP23 [Camellia lanceoleosa]|uniref:F-box protein SKIP23 n=1 Tax=Camellia lanceoleosa TaxID=1840588 RepID=A0ACC0FV48_9ERIC|nr:F-box protein SKIP23 [Camellia lanceoleosa]